ncbi:MAG: DUF4290 domain-containing protein [Bacteroidia bacterium]|nr:DUF4290 domain-containing protein [Bacteroidia bacterium]
MAYNTQRKKLLLPEYGRYIHEWIQYCCEIPDREERNLCARAIIEVMGNMNPQLRDSQDFHHKLWDHLFIMSENKLDIDSPFPKPDLKSNHTPPEKIPYPTKKIKFRPYGRTIERIIEKAKSLPEGDEKNELIRQIANHLKKSYMNWNKEQIGDDVVFQHLNALSEGGLKASEGLTLSSHEELRGNQNKKHFKKVKNRFHRNNHRK